MCLLEVLHGLGVLAAEKPAPASSPMDLLLASFERYLVAERGLAAGTVVGVCGARALVLGRAWSGGMLCRAVGG